MPGALQTSAFAENANVALPPMFQDVSGTQDTPLPAPMNAINHIAATWGKYAKLNQTSTGLPSWVFYRSVLINVTATGEDRREIHALNYMDFVRLVASTGGRYFGDTYTAPTTLA